MTTISTPVTSAPQPELTLWQRMMADSGPFWKKVELYGLILGATVAALKENVPTIPTTWLALAAGVSAAMVGAALVAVKNASILENPNSSLQDYVNAIPQLSSDIAAVKKTVVATIATEEVPATTPIPVASILVPTPGSVTPVEVPNTNFIATPGVNFTTTGTAIPNTVVIQAIGSTTAG